MANPVVIVGINAVDRTGKAVQSVQANFGKIGRTAGAAFTKVKVGATVALGAVTAVTAGVVKLTSAYAKMDLETGRIAKTTKATVKEVSSLRQEFKRFNLEGDDVRDVLNEINVKLFDAQDEASAAAEAFNVLGLDASALADSGSYEALLDIADGLNQIESAADRAGAADAIFGGDLAQRLLPILEQGSEALRANAAEYERLGLVIDERAVAAAERFHAAQGRVNQAVEGLGRTIATTALPYVTAFTNVFAGFLNQVPQLLKGRDTLQTAFSTMFKNLPAESKVTFAQVYLGIVSALQSGVNNIYAFAREGELVFHNMAASVAKSFADGLNPIIEGANRIGALIPGFQPIDPITVDTGGFVSSIGDAPIIPTDAAIMQFAKEDFESVARYNATARPWDGVGQGPLGMAYGHLLATQLERSPSSDYQGRVAAHQQGDFTASPNFPDLTPTAGGLAIASLAGLGILNAADALLLRVPSTVAKKGISIASSVAKGAARYLPRVYNNRLTGTLARDAATRASKFYGSFTDDLAALGDSALQRQWPRFSGSFTDDLARLGAQGLSRQWPRFSGSFTDDLARLGAQGLSRQWPRFSGSFTDDLARLGAQGLRRQWPRFGASFTDDLARLGAQDSGSTGAGQVGRSVIDDVARHIFSALDRRGGPRFMPLNAPGEMSRWFNNPGVPTQAQARAQLTGEEFLRWIRAKNSNTVFARINRNTGRFLPRLVGLGGDILGSAPAQALLNPFARRYLPGASPFDIALTGYDMFFGQGAPPARAMGWHESPWSTYSVKGDTVRGRVGLDYLTYQPYTDALGRTFGTNPAFANPSGWYSGTGGPPPIIIENIHVADGEDFVDKVTDAWTEAWREGRLDEEAYRNR